MTVTARKAASPPRRLAKAPTGIDGIDEITAGGLPKGRPTLVCGSAGCGKTLLAMEFLVRGATQFDEPGVFMAFEESGEELAQNVASLGFDLPQLEAKKRIVVDSVRVERSEIEETGEYDLEGLFIRLGLAIDSIGAKRVVLDTLEVLFGGLSNTAVLRSELKRLFRWLKDKGVTTIVTGERGEGQLTRHGLEEYISDCVILLDHRVNEQRSTRRLRIVKYRGSFHGTNEYPFLIGEHGLSVLPITSAGLNHAASDERVSSGVPALDEMLGGRGYYRGTSIMVSGTAGTGKTSLGAHFVAAACSRGERCLYFAFEESERQLVRNMRSIGIDLDPWIDKGLLQVHASRPTLHGLESHLVEIHRLIAESKPDVVVLDPISNFTSAGSVAEAEGMLVRLIDYLKRENVTGFFTNLTSGGAAFEKTEVGVSSLIDTWLLLRDIESGGERNRGLYVLKSRGMIHSNQIREYLLTEAGVRLLDVYVGPEGVLTGSLRVAQEAREQAELLELEQEMVRRTREFERKRDVLRAQSAALQTELELIEAEAAVVARQDRARVEVLTGARAAMQRRRSGSAERRATNGAPQAAAAAATKPRSGARAGVTRKGRG